jgi:molybdate transport system substrate-binding protein
MTRVTGKRSVGLSVSRSIGRAWLGLMATALIVVSAGIPLVAQRSLTVAAAANLQSAVKEIAEKFEKQGGTHVSLVFGSSGNLTTQIENGAPYDVFLSADMSYPERLASGGLGIRESLQRYAVGKLVLWVTNDSHIDLERLGEHPLLDPAVHKIAIANPAHAPYGAAAVAYLKTANLHDQVNDKQVLGEDVAQTAQFVISGNAQVGIIPLSLALAPKMLETGTYYALKNAPTVEQGAIVLSKTADKRAAGKFLEFMKSPDARAILQRYGYDLPGAKP